MIRCNKLVSAKLMQCHGTFLAYLVDCGTPGVIMTKVPFSFGGDASETDRQIANLIFLHYHGGEQTDMR